MSGKKAVVLSSGGIDSTTAMAIAGAEGYDLYSLTFHYGQRHACELHAARKAADFFRVKKHLVIDIDLRPIGGSALTDQIDVPKGRGVDDMAQEIPVTYVPARNTIFLSYALAWAEVLQAADIFIGVNAVDYSGYPDCRPAFIAAYERLANQGGGGGKTAHDHPGAADLDDQGGDHQKRDRVGRRLRPDSQLLRPLAGGRGLRPVRQLHPEKKRIRGCRRSRSDRICRLLTSPLFLLAEGPVGPADRLQEVVVLHRLVGVRHPEAGGVEAGEELARQDDELANAFLTASPSFSRI